MQNRTNASTILLVFVAVLFGLLGVYSLRKLSNRKAPIAAPSAQKITVPMASRRLPTGRVVTLSDVALERLTRRQLKERNVTGMFMSSPDQIIGQTVMTTIERGQTFHTQQFYPKGYGPNLTDKLEPGQRAVTILVNSNDALNGFADAGQLVDVIFRAGLYGDSDVTGLATPYESKWDPKLGYHGYRKGAGGGWDYTRNLRTPRGRNSTTGGSTDTTPYATDTVTLMQGVKVLALENNTVQDNVAEVTGVDTVRVTLSVSPDQAETLRVVEGRGKLSLTLRNPADNKFVKPGRRKTIEDILGRRVEQQRRVAETMEVYRGGGAKQLKFDGRHPLAVRAAGTSKKLPPRPDSISDLPTHTSIEPTTTREAAIERNAP